MKLNVGCGKDNWGDIRVDITKKYSKTPTLNIMADAHYLPFKDKIFSETRCWHVLEHVKDVYKVLKELLRVSEKVDIQYPIKSYPMWRRYTYVSLQILQPWVIIRILKEHKWEINPNNIAKFLIHERVPYKINLMCEPIRLKVNDKENRIIKMIGQKLEYPSVYQIIVGNDDVL